MLKINILNLILFGSLFGSHTCSIIPTDTSVGKLIFSQILFRHGDRNPSQTYPTDPWIDDDNWPEGYGQLTKIGIKQQYELGQYLRERYKELIPSNVFPNHLVYVQSSEFDRTVMSAQAVLAGLFPPVKDQIWNDDLLWQPIPVHVIPHNIDIWLHSEKPLRSCPQYQNLEEQSLQDDAYTRWRSEHKWLYDYLEKNSGKSMQKPINIVEFYDTLQIQRSKDKATPDWVNEVFDEIDELSMFEWGAFRGSRNMTRFSRGYLIREIFERFTNRTKGPFSPDRKIWIYSAHDFTIASALDFLNIPFDFPVTYSTSLLFELYELNGEHYVQIFYKSTNEKDIPPLNIPGCGTKCSLDNLYKLYASMIPMHDFETECRLNV